MHKECLLKFVGACRRTMTAPHCVARLCSQIRGGFLTNQRYPTRRETVVLPDLTLTWKPVDSLLRTILKH